MENLKEYFYNVNNYSDPIIKKFIYDFTDKFNPFLLISLNKEFVNSYLLDLDEMNEWRVKDDNDPFENLFGKEEIDKGTNVLCRIYSYLNGVFKTEEVREQKCNLSYSDHSDMTNKIYAFQFCMQEIINSENSKAKPTVQNLDETLIAENKVNPFPLLFVNDKVYNCFKEYTRKHIIDFYTDYSYLKKRLEKEKLIHYRTDNSFVGFLFKDAKLISQKNFEHYTGKYESKLKSLSKSYNVNRENNFNTIFENVLKPA